MANLSFGVSYDMSFNPRVASDIPNPPPDSQKYSAWTAFLTPTTQAVYDAVRTTSYNFTGNSLALYGGHMYAEMEGVNLKATFPKDIAQWQGTYEQAIFPNWPVYNNHTGYDAINKYSYKAVKSGTVTAYKEYTVYGGDQILSLTGINYKATALAQVLSTGLGYHHDILAASLTGNDTITGSDFDDVLMGYAGNDTIDGGLGDDVIYGGSGNDTIFDVDGGFFYGDSGNDTITSTATGSDGFVYMNGGDGNDTLLMEGDVGSFAAGDYFGGAGDDTITAGALGSDSFSGGDGNDVIVASTRPSSTQYDPFVEFSFDNDFIYGGNGNDTLTGGAGPDYFVFDTPLSEATNFDRVTDFWQDNTLFGGDEQDKLQLDTNIFKSLANGLTSNNILVTANGTAALDGDDYLIFNSTSKKLYYDADGSGSSSSAIAFAQLDGISTLTTNDFFLFHTDGSFKYGSTAIDSLTSEANEDNILFGGLGNDILTLGTDTFRDHVVFNTLLSKNNIDTIKNFNYLYDNIILDSNIFTNITDDLEMYNICFGTKALDVNDFIIINAGTKNCTISYDADGSGKVYKPIVFATLNYNVNTNCTKDLIKANFDLDNITIFDCLLRPQDYCNLTGINYIDPLSLT
jgi:Ca2+-binding RTX toxin-like protein